MENSLHSPERPPTPIGNNPKAIEIVSYVEYVLAEAPQIGALRSGILIRDKIDERRFGGWVGSLESYRNMARGPKEEAPVSHAIEATASEIRTAINHAPKTQIQALENGSHADKEKNGLSKSEYYKGLNAGEIAELESLLRNLNLPPKVAGKKRRFGDTSRNLARIGYLLKKKGHGELSRFLKSQDLASPEFFRLVRPFQNAATDGNPVSRENIAGNNMPIEPVTESLVEKEKTLTDDEEAELARLVETLHIPNYQRGIRRIFAEDQKRMILRIGELFIKENEGGMKAFLDEYHLDAQYYLIKEESIHAPWAKSGSSALHENHQAKETEVIVPILPETTSAAQVNIDTTLDVNRLSTDIEEAAGQHEETKPKIQGTEIKTTTAVATITETGQKKPLAPIDPPSPKTMSIPSIEQNTPGAPELKIAPHAAIDNTQKPVRLAIRSTVESNISKPNWVHSTSQTEAALPNALEDDRLLAASALKQTNLIMKGDPKMEALWERLCIAAKGDNCVLIRGEPGVGKEPMSHAIHLIHSHGNGKNYWRMNCAGIAESLAESELFGHEKGAFTGADKEHKGAFEMVDNGGTILLDEVGDMPLALQAKLLRVLEAREFIRVGSDKIRKLENVKIIAATNRPLEEMIAEGKFRKDLYGRLRAEEIYVPNLEERSKQHRIGLIGHFLQLLGKQYERIPGMTQDAFDFFMSDEIEYQENVRGLRDHMERAFKFASATAGRVVDIDLIHAKNSVPFVADMQSGWRTPEEGQSDAYFDGALNIGFTDDGSKMDVCFDLDKIDANGSAMFEAAYKIFCHAVVRHCGDNQSKAAKALNITRGTLLSKLQSSSVIQSIDTRVRYSIDTEGSIEDGTGR